MTIRAKRDRNNADDAQFTRAEREGVRCPSPGGFVDYFLFTCADLSVMPDGRHQRVA